MTINPSVYILNYYPVTLFITFEHYHKMIPVNTTLKYYFKILQLHTTIKTLIKYNN